MTKLQVIPFKPEHLKQIEIKRIHQGEMPQTVMTAAATFVVRDRPVAIIGGFFFVPGVIHFWALISEEVRDTPMQFHNACRKMLRFYLEKYQPRRVQLDVRADYDEGIRWAELLGFKKEGLLIAYCPDGAGAWLMGRGGL